MRAWLTGLFCLLGAGLFMGGGGCAAGSGTAGRYIPLGRDLAPLRARFNAAAGLVRVIALVSPS